jgi:hypothetical protein
MAGRPPGSGGGRSEMADGSMGDRATRVVLRDSRDEGGSRHLSAALRPDGGLLIDGQDLGPGVEGVFGAGNTEYEWAWTVAADDVPAALAALGGEPGADPLAVLARWFGEHRTDPGSRLRDAGVPVAFWSRVGD